MIRACSPNSWRSGCRSATRTCRRCPLPAMLFTYEPCCIIRRHRSGPHPPSLPPSPSSCSSTSPCSPSPPFGSCPSSSTSSLFTFSRSANNCNFPHKTPTTSLNFEPLNAAIKRHSHPQPPTRISPRVRRPQHMWDVFFLEGSKILFRCLIPLPLFPIPSPSLSLCSPSHHLPSPFVPHPITSPLPLFPIPSLTMASHHPPLLEERNFTVCRVALSVIKIKERDLLQMTTFDTEANCALYCALSRIDAGLKTRISA